MIELINISCEYNKKHILKDIDLKIVPGEIISLAGPNGAGKSTLIKCIMGLIKPLSGDILIDNRSISNLSKKNIAQKIAYVPQYNHIKFPVTVFEMVLRGRKPHINWKPDNTDIDKAVLVLKDMGLLHLASRDINTLSGGELQKILLARAFVQNTPYILLDEPINNLDIYHQLDIMHILKQKAKKDKLGILIAIHELNLAINYTDKILIINKKKVFKQGKPIDVLNRENIREVYKIDVNIYKSEDYTIIHPLKRSKQ